MADTLTADMAKELMAHHIDFSFASGLYFAGCMQSIADGAHAVIPAEELADLRTQLGRRERESDLLAAERDRLAAELAAMKQAIADPENQPSQYGTVLVSEYDRLAGINQQMLEALTVLLMEAETFSVSGVYFTEPCMQHKGPALAHAAIAAATRGREE